MLNKNNQGFSKLILTYILYTLLKTLNVTLVKPTNHSTTGNTFRKISGKVH